MPDPPGPSVAAARERLVEAARLAAVGRLLPSLAHQLSTPLASIALRAESLGKEADAAGAPPGRAARYLQAILDDTGRCKELLGVMREFARPPAGAREPVDLNALCRDAARLVAHEAMRRQVEVAVEAEGDPPAVPGDEVRLRGAVLGLVLDAIDASPAGGRVTVETRVDEAAVLVTVTDQGEPLPADARERLFEPFSSARPGGLGLGLMACRAVAEAHGGTVEADAPPGGGSRLTLRLPARRDEAAPREGDDGPRRP
jgi:signal transduction histidine kinase